MLNNDNVLIRKNLAEALKVLFDVQDSFDNNDIFMKSHEIAIGNSYHDAFFEEFVLRKRVR